MKITKITHLFNSIVLFALIILALLTNVNAAEISSKGKSFVFSFNPNMDSVLGRSVYRVYITSDQDATGTVKAAGKEYPFSVTAGGIKIVYLSTPWWYKSLTPDARTSNNVRVVADNDISVYALNQRGFSTDAFMVLPIKSLGTEYIAMSYESRYAHWPSQISIIGTQSNTEVTITPTSDTTKYKAGETFTVTLGNGQVYYMTAPGEHADLTGTIISASNPVGVMSGSLCTNVPFSVRACDHLEEMVPAVSTWGKSFLTVPLATRKKGDIFRILAAQDNTVIKINGEEVATLQRGQFHERFIIESSEIEANAPVLVAQYAVGQLYDNVTSDPFMMLVPPKEQFLSKYAFSTMQLYYGQHYINVVVPNSGIHSITLDGVIVDANKFEPIGVSGFSGAQLSVAKGAHYISGTDKFGLFVYGFSGAESYGYPGGMAIEKINSLGDQYVPNVKLIELDGVVNGVAVDNEDININGLLDPGEDLNNNGVIDQRSEDLNNNGQLDAGEDTNADGILDRDRGIASVALEDGSSNLVVNLSNFVPGSLRAEFTVTRIDPTQPAAGNLIVSDKAGNKVISLIDFSDKNRLRNVKVVSTLSTDKLSLDSTTFSVEPTTVSTENGRTVIEWNFSQINIDQLESMDFEVVLHNLIAGETRTVSNQVDVYYTDVNGNAVHTGLGKTTVNVLPSIITVESSTDKTSYLPTDVVIISATVNNLSAYEATAYLNVVIKDNKGNIVYTVPSQSITIAAEQNWLSSNLTYNINNAYEGLYEVHVEVTNEQGASYSKAVSSFVINTAVENKVSASITSDKLTYDAVDTVTLTDRIRNEATNAIIDGHTAVTTIFNPDGSVFWTSANVLPQLIASTTHNITHPVPLNGAVPGEYNAVLIVKDADGVERALSQTSITVLSSAATGKGLNGTLTTSPQHVYKTESLQLNATVFNSGNVDLVNTPVYLTLIDPANSVIINEWQKLIPNLLMNNTGTFNVEWQSLAPVGSTFVAVLSTEINGQRKNLATTNISTIEKLTPKYGLGERGRLLVLMDEFATSNSCDDLNELRLEHQFTSLLSSAATLQVDVVDAWGKLVDSENVALATTTQNIDVNSGNKEGNLIVTSSSQSALAIKLQAQSTSDNELGDAYQVNVTVLDGTNTIQLMSGVINTHCDEPLLLETRFGDFVLTGLENKIDDSDPHGPQAAPSMAQQHAFLTQQLQNAGWSYTIVTDDDDFTRELRTGSYTSYALLGEHEKLEKDAQKELREAVYRGEGLVIAGSHDERSHHLNKLLGVKVKGKRSGINELTLLPATPFNSLLSLGLTQALSYEDKVLRAILETATIAATFNLPPESSSSSEHDKDHDEDDSHGDENIAIAYHQYGLGKTIYVGFDLLAQATASQSTELLDDILNQTLVYSQPDIITPQAGRVVPVSLMLTNQGSTTKGKVTFTLPEGVSVVDSSQGSVNANTFTWLFNADSGQTVGVSLWLQLPENINVLNLSALVQVGSTSNWMNYDILQFEIQPVIPPTLLQIQNVVNELAVNYEFNKVKTYINKSVTALNNLDYHGVLHYLLEATDELISIENTVYAPQASALRLQIDSVIVNIAKHVPAEEQSHKE